MIEVIQVLIGTLNNVTYRKKPLVFYAQTLQRWLMSLSNWVNFIVTEDNLETDLRSRRQHP